MRKEFSESLIDLPCIDNIVFLTGDLGFMALEPIKEKLQNRFINAGIAEQNMISVAAGLSKSSFNVWVYSIAPFCYARPFEQIRNDIAMHNLPVKLVGNGGGYGYGVMGPTHHAIEDYGVLLTLPNMEVCAPVFDSDVVDAVKYISEYSSPVYLRLGLGKIPEGFDVPKFEPWRQIIFGNGPLLVCFGSIATTFIELFNSIDYERRPNFWVVSMLPISIYSPPDDFLKQIKSSENLIVVEEHVQQGGFGSGLIMFLAGLGMVPKNFKHFFAKAHCFDRYGSQTYMRKKSSLDIKSIQDFLNTL